MAIAGDGLGRREPVPSQRRQVLYTLKAAFHGTVLCRMPPRLLATNTAVKTAHYILYIPLSMAQRCRAENVPRRKSEGRFPWDCFMPHAAAAFNYKHRCENRSLYFVYSPFHGAENIPRREYASPKN